MFNVTIPAVDGILFDSAGHAVANFSLKSVGSVNDVNFTIKRAVSEAEESVAKNYGTDRWWQIFNNYIKSSYSEEYRRSMHDSRRRIFGVRGSRLRHVVVVIDYSDMPGRGSCDCLDSGLTCNQKDGDVYSASIRHFEDQGGGQ